MHAVALNQSELTTELLKRGLEPSVWLTIFKDELGIDKVQQLQHLTELDLKKLEKYTDKPWEIKTLYNLINKKKENVILLKRVLTNVKESLTSIPESENEHLEKLRSLLRVPESQWKCKFTEIQKEKIVNSLEFQIEIVNDCISELSFEDEEVIKNASGGLAFMGVYVSEDINDLCVSRQTVIQLCKPVNLRSAVNQQIDEIIDFSSQEMSSNFHRAMDVVGVNISAFVKGSNWRIGALFSRENQKSKSSSSSLHRGFYSRVKYSSIPIKSCELKPTDICLVSEAVEFLLNIEYLDQLFCREEFIIAECKQFFMQFGSHVNIGMLHFGGIYKWISTYSNETQFSNDCTQQLVANSLNCYMNSYVPCITSLGVEVSAQCLLTKDKISQSYSEFDLSNTRLTVKKCGGPTEIDDFYAWKYLLSSCNDKWSLIDRGNLHGIWEIIEFHTIFKNSLKLSQILEKAWMDRLDASNMNFSKDRRFAKLLASLLEEVQHWNEAPNASKCSSILEQILHCKELKIEIDGNILHWTNLLHREASIKQFFAIIVDQGHNYGESQISYVKFLVREIVHPACDDRFLSWFDIIKWSKETTEVGLSILEKESVKTLTELLLVIKDNVLPSFITSSLENEVKKKSMEEEVTILVAKLCFRCFSSLDDKGDSYDIVLLKLMLIRLRYDNENYFFPIYLSGSDLQKFIDESESDLDRYNSYIECSIQRLQAFLIHKIVVRLRQTYLSENMLGKFDECLSSIRHMLDEPISDVILEYKNSYPCNWQDLENDLLQIERGEVVSRPIFSIPNIHFHLPQTTADVSVETYCSDTFKGYLRQIGLFNYFPDKISIRDILLKNINREQPQYTDLPWVFLRDILMLNSSGRDESLKTLIDRLTHLNNPVAVLDNWNIIDDFSVPEPKVQPVNPLDIIVAVYKCCTPSLKQTLAMNLFSCKQAVPLILPPVKNDVPLTISLWPLRQIFIEQKRNNAFVKASAIHFPCRIVSFIRLTNIKVSKSKIINQILSDKCYNTCFNCDCPLGNVERWISDGMVEAAWYIPKNDENENVTLFLNLRGNAMYHTQQRDFLIRMSSVLVVAIAIKDLEDEKKTKAISDIHLLERKVILAVDAWDARCGDSAGKICKTYLTSIGKLIDRTAILRLALNGKILSLCDVAKSIKAGITLFSSEDTGIVSIYDQLQNTNIRGVISDEELLPVHKTVSERIDELKQLIPTNSQNLKAEIVPVQSMSWVSLSEIFKTLTKTSEFIPQDKKENLKREMIKKRYIQLELIENLNKFMVAFISILSEASGQTVYCEIFMSRLKLILFEASKLEQIENEYHLALVSLKSARKKDMLDIPCLQATINECEKKLSVASFGFEHLTREIGQIYEALTEPELQTKIDQQSKDTAAKFPRICARIIAMGHPFEIMDGDAANVPQRWVKSVLSELKAMLGDKKCFILSALGVQSSGKSTLLNTMFGLNFPVSAGRCTRGIFMQLVPIQDQTCRYDFVLAMDTEGLRAPKSINENYDNDNKLAIFVIGMADLTIINIKGENPSDLKDILQITVIAFLRLRQVRSEIQMNQRCVFVHQNVSAINAVQKLARNRENLVKQLNEITKEAAENEKTEISTFRQMIEFDSVHDISYFPELWLGSPPMAPRNPEYSAAAAELKRSILTENANVDRHYLTLTNISLRIENLWVAILSDDFVYNFRNSLELKAYTILENYYQDAVFKMEKYAFEFIHSDARSELVDCDEDSSLEEKVSVLLKRCKRKILELSQILKKEITHFIKNHQHQDKMKQWEQNKLIKLNVLTDHLVDNIQSEIHTLKEECRMAISQFHGGHFVLELKNLATEQARRLDGKVPDDKELEQIFHEKWIEWMMKFSSANPKQVRKSVENEISDHAYKTFVNIALNIEKYNSKPSPQDFKNMKRLEGSILPSDLESQHVEVMGVFFEKFRFWRDKENYWRNKTIEFTDAVFAKIDSHLDQVREEDTAFHKSMSIAIFNIIKDDIQKYNMNKSIPFTLQPSYEAMIVVHVLRYTTCVFDTVNSDYNFRHSPLAQLEKHKHTTFITFKGLVQKNSDCVIAADVFLDILKQKTIAYVSQNIPIDLYRQVQIQFVYGKASILKCVLASLVEDGSYKKLSGYIKNPNHAVRQLVKKHIDDTILTPLEGGTDSEYTRIAKKCIHKIFKQLSKCVSVTCKSNPDNTYISQWVSTFVENVNMTKSLPLSRKDFVSMSDKCVDVGDLNDCILNQISGIKENVCVYFEASTHSELKGDSVKRLLGMFWGCEVTCPFCNEPCKQANKDHVKDGIPHECLQHRVTGLNGTFFEPERYQFWANDKLQIETCDDLIKSDLCFYYNGDYVPYEDYNKYIPKWEISSGKCSNQFWKWCTFKYKSDIEKDFKIKLSKIPDSWKDITKKEAIDSLL